METYFRLTEKADDLTKGSIEVDSITREFAATLHNCDVDELDDVLDESNLYYDDETGSIRWQGVCCCDSLESLADYVSGWMVDFDNLSDKVIIEFEGEYLDDCRDGDVAIPKRIVKVHPVSILAEYL